MNDENQNLSEEGHDVFDDSENEIQTVEEKEVVKSEETSTEKVEVPEDEENSEETGEKQEVEASPAENKDEDDNQSEKMIPEHRFKAAIKDINEKYEAAQAKLAQLEAKPTPDRETDPDGYDLHMRMETSKTIMAETHEDYDEMIRHYIEMEKTNPVLAQVVSAHPIPAKHAYELAKKDLEIRELSTLKQSNDWVEFQEFKKQKELMAKEEAEKAKQASKLEREEAEQSDIKNLSKVPNLNRATDVSGKAPPAVSDDEDLFAGAL